MRATSNVENNINDNKISNIQIDIKILVIFITHINIYDLYILLHLIHILHIIK